MELLLQHQEALITIFKAVVFILSFILVIIMTFYNWLYLSRVLKSNHRIGLHPPENIHHLVKTSIFIPVFTALFIIFFLMTGYY
jgi:hypothetical protein